MRFFKDAKPLLMPDGSRPTTPAQEIDARLHRYDAEKLSGISDPEKRTRTRETIRAAMIRAEEKRQVRMEAFRAWDEAELQWIDAQPQGSPQAAKREMARWKREQRHHGYLGKGIEQEIGTIEAIIQRATGEGGGRAERRKSFFSSRTRQQETNRSRGRDRERER